MLWKETPQQFIVKDMICMKKLLAICSIFFTVCATLTGCGDNNDGHYTDDGNGTVIEDTTTDKKYESTSDDHPIRDRAEDAVDGVGDAGKDIIDGAGDAGKEAIDGVKDAADNVIDGLDGKKEHDEEKTTSRKNR